MHILININSFKLWYFLDCVLTGRGEPEGVQKGETLIRIFCMGKDSTFNKRGGCGSSEQSYSQLK